MKKTHHSVLEPPTWEDLSYITRKAAFWRALSALLALLLGLAVYTAENHYQRVQCLQRMLQHRE